MGTVPTDSPITSEPRRLRPPYDVPDTTFDHLRAVETAAWCVALREDRLRTLLEPLDGLTVTDYERRILEWASGFDLSTCAILAVLLPRARAAEPQS
jgi:hypothetical protein